MPKSSGQAGDKQYHILLLSCFPRSMKQEGSQDGAMRVIHSVSSTVSHLSCSRLWICSLSTERIQMTKWNSPWHFTQLKVRNVNLILYLNTIKKGFASSIRYPVYVQYSSDIIHPTEQELQHQCHRLNRKGTVTNLCGLCVFHR